MQDLTNRFPYLSRRSFLFAGSLAFAPGVRAADPACTLTHEKEEGPYYLDDEILRRDITEQRPGVPLVLDLKLVDSRTCAPLGNAAVDIWHCDASGLYSGFTANSPNGGPGPQSGRRPGSGLGFGPPFGGPPPDGAGRGFRPGGPPRGRQTDSTRFLRGVQLTNGAGDVQFATLYPGWYVGRAIHIHLKVHLGGAANETRYAGGHVAHTGQLFLPEDLTDRISRLAPYAQRLEIRRTLQTEDGIFRSQHGTDSMLRVERLGKTDADGFRATATLAVDPDATPAPVRGFGGPPPRGA